MISRGIASKLDQDLYFENLNKTLVDLDLDTARLSNFYLNQE